MNKPVRPSEIKRKKFAVDVLSGKPQGQAYQDNVAKTPIKDRNTLDVTASQYLRNPKTQQEILNALPKELTAERLINMLYDKAENGKKEDIQLRAIELLGKTNLLSIFKQDVAPNNILNVIDYEGIRRRLAPDMAITDDACGKPVDNVVHNIPKPLPLQDIQHNEQT